LRTFGFVLVSDTIFAEIAIREVIWPVGDGILVKAQEIHLNSRLLVLLLVRYEFRVPSLAYYLVTQYLQKTANRQVVWPVGDEIRVNTHQNHQNSSFLSCVLVRYE
jgi:hypothetical protein